MKAVFSHKRNPLSPRRFGAGVALGLTALAVSAFVPMTAQAQTLGDVMCNAAFNITPFIWLFTGVAYIAGALFLGQGLFMLVRHHDNARETQLHNPIMHLVGGSALLAFPSFINLVIHSLGLVGNGGGGMPVCGGFIGFPGFGGVGLDQLMMNLVYNIRDPLTVLTSIAAIVIGVLMIFRGLVKASKYGLDPRGTKISHILGNLTVGAILIVVGQSLNTMLATLFGPGFIASSSDVLSWNFFSMLPAGGGTARFQLAVMAALTFIQLVGMIAFVRGWIIVKDAIEGSGQAKMTQGFTHIVGGVFAINIFSFLELMDSTFGSGFL